MVTFAKISTLMYYYTCINGRGFFFVYPESNKHITLLFDTRGSTFSIFLVISSIVPRSNQCCCHPRHHHIVWKYVKMVSGLLPLCFLFITLLCKIAKFSFSFFLSFPRVFSVLTNANGGKEDSKWMMIP